MIHSKYIFGAAFFLAALNLHAQKELPGERIDVIKDFDARLLESNKLNVPPSLPALDTSTQRQDYLVPARPLTVKYDAPKLRPIGMKAGKKEEDYNGFVKLGGGVPAAIWGEVGYGLSKEKFDGKIWFRHHQQNATRSRENQRFALNDGLINANYFINDKLAVEGKVGYSYDRVHFYGYNDDSLSFIEDRVRQDYKILDVGARLYNKERTDMDLNFAIAPKFYLLNDFYGNKESGFDLNLGATKWFSERHPLRFVLRTDFTSFNDTVPQKLNNIYLQPSFTLHFDAFYLKLGGNFASNRDEFSIFPDAELGLRVLGDGFQLFVGADGDLRKNTYRSMSDYNPFIQIRESKLRNTEFYHYYGGLKGDFGWLTYNGQVGYTQATNLALFQTTFTADGITRFKAVYDTVDIVNVQGAVKLTLFKNLVINGTLSQNITMDPEREEKPWGLPKLEGNFSGIYSVLDGKAALKANCYVADGIWFKDVEGITRQGKVLLDLGIGGSYYFTKNIGVFLDINNLLNNRRARWNNYPMIGTNFLGGITARF